MESTTNGCLIQVENCKYFTEPATPEPTGKKDEWLKSCLKNVSPGGFNCLQHKSYVKTMRKGRK